MSNKKDINDYYYVTEVLEESYNKTPSPSVTLVASLKKHPYHILISTIISLRTKDKVTLEASHRLFEKADSIKDLAKLSEETIGELIYPCGFYKTKAKNMLKICDIIENEYNGKIPDDIDELMKLPGVGRKTANLVLILGYNQDTICVDTHVHRLSNRLGWVVTKTPDDTEFALKEIVPVKLWKDLNDYMVSYGQMICKPISPHCSECKLNDICPKVGVIKHR